MFCAEATTCLNPSISEVLEPFFPKQTQGIAVRNKFPNKRIICTVRDQFVTNDVADDSVSFDL